jgi:hypothetical protein
LSSPPVEVGVFRFAAAIFEACRRFRLSSAFRFLSNSRWRFWNVFGFFGIKFLYNVLFDRVNAITVAERLSRNELVTAFASLARDMRLLAAFRTSLIPSPAGRFLRFGRLAFCGPKPGDPRPIRLLNRTLRVNAA